MIAILLIIELLKQVSLPPHGSLALRACLSCSGLIDSFGDSWYFDSNSLSPPSLILSLPKMKPER